MLFRTFSGRCPCECRCVEHLSEVALSVRSLALPPSQGGVPERRSVELLSELALSVLSLAFSNLLREVPLSVGAGNPSARCRSAHVPSLFRTCSGGVPECRYVDFLSKVLAFSHRFREVSLSVGPWNSSARWCRVRVLSFSHLLREVVPECRSVELLSEVVLSFSHLLREVSLSVGPWNFSVRGC